MTRPTRSVAWLVIAGLAGCGNDSSTNPSTDTVASVTVTLAAAMAQPGDSVQATAVLRDSGGSTISGRAVSWRSSAPGVASVNSSGLVTAVAEGSADIIATSGSASGQATLAVASQTAQLGALALTDALGQPVNLSNVGGSLDVAVVADLPPGASGTLVARIDGVELARQTITGTTIVVGAGSRVLAAATAGVTGHLQLNTAAVNYTLSGDEIEAVPLTPNGVRTLSVDLLVPGQAQPVATSQASVTLRNPDAFAARITPDQSYR